MPEGLAPMFSETGPTASAEGAGGDSVVGASPNSTINEVGKLD
jgi:hypothetical protein